MECGSVCTCSRIDLGPLIAAPILSEGEEELLQGSEAILLGVQIDAFTLGIGEECKIGQAQTAVVGRIFT